MDEAWSSGVAEVEQSKVEQIDDEEDLAFPEETSDPEENEGSAEEIVLLMFVSWPLSISKDRAAGSSPG